MRIGKNRLILFHILILGILFIWLPGCRGTFLSYQGKTVEPYRQIPLSEGGPHRGTFDTRELRLVYIYQKDGDNLRFFGRVQLPHGLMMFNNIDHLYLSLHFLDRKGRILESTRIYSPGYRTWMWLVKWSFERSLKVPPEGTAFVFSYKGQVRDKSVTWDFWVTPFEWLGYPG